MLHVGIVRHDELLESGHDGEVEAVVADASASLAVVHNEVADWPRVRCRVHLPVHGAVNADERWSEDAPESNFSFWCGALDLVGGEAEQAVVAARIRSEARKLGRIRGVVVDEVPVRSLHRPGASVQLQKGIAWLLVVLREVNGVLSLCTAEASNFSLEAWCPAMFARVGESAQGK